MRIDKVPTELYKFNGDRWINVDKNMTDNYTYNDAYIAHLIEQISLGNYEFDMLTDGEREQIERHLKQD